MILVSYCLIHSGVTGTFEGYVATNKDIYNRGTWGSGYSSNNLVAFRRSGYGDGSAVEPSLTIQAVVIKMDGKQSTWEFSGGFTINKAINLTAYNTINVVHSCDKESTLPDVYIRIYSNIPTYIDDDYIKSVYTEGITRTEQTTSMDVSSINREVYIGFGFMRNIDADNAVYIHRIYFT